MNITIVGLGPGQVEQMTLLAWRTLEHASEVYLRTKHHPLVESLPTKPTYHSFDDLYDKAEDFEALYQTIAEQIVALGLREGGVIYAVPGHPMVGEQTTQLILETAHNQNIPVKIVDGISFIEPSLSALKIDGITGLQIHDATDFIHLYHPPINPDQPALIAQVYSQAVASDTKLTLMNQYPDDYPVVLLHGAGTANEIIEHLPLYELDRSEHISYLTTLYVPPMSHPSSFQALLNIMAHLRSPEGCPWDIKQTHQSLRAHFIEEAYEVIEALDAEDMESLSEELGDILLHVAFQSQIAVDEGEFYITTVVRHIIEKMVRRHPHIFGEVEVEDADHVVRNWEAIKQQEQAQKGKNGRKARESRLDGIPAAVPALIYAYRVQEKAAQFGFDWPDVEPVIQKVEEEIREIREANDPESRAKEVGDLLFAVVNWARWMKVDAEAALRGTNERFKRRFAFIETAAKENGRQIETMTLQEMDSLWDEAKRQGL
ncbi:MAG: nucleoside triphosphate pyrophosphohydrolase [Anaerolineae bacterium]|nr:nucleoside triphosphate pyrophosphohydrolase [Anaerolineae bacterium]